VNRDYELLASNYSDELSRMVNVALFNGYIPCAGIAVVPRTNTDSQIFIQAVIKAEALERPARVLIKKISGGTTDQLEKEMVEFISWLTPCGQVKPSPSVKVIGREARRLYKKIIDHVANRPRR
jgi:hypothetical protein